MRKGMQLMLGAALALSVSACQDSQAASDIQAMKTSLNTWMQQVDDWHNQMRDAVCQLEHDVYNVPDSRGDTRTAGPTADPGSHRLCPTGPGDPDGRPPPPPQL